MAIEIYAKRWSVETLFGCLKTKGFNFEDTHLKSPDRINNIIVLLTIGFCWCHKSENQRTKKCHVDHKYLKPLAYITGISSCSDNFLFSLL